MTTVRSAPATAIAVAPRDLAAALRGAGLTEVDDSARRRAEYSSDASNYRVVPSVVAFPRHADEAAAALDVARRARRAGDQPRRRDLDRGQRGRGRRRARLLPAPEPGAVGRSRGTDRGGRAGRDPGRHHRGRGRVRAAVRPGPVHALAGQHRRRDRQQRLRLARAAVRPHGRQRGEPGRADRLGGAADGAAHGPGRPGRRRACRRRPRRPGRGAPRPDPHRVRPVHPAGVRLLHGAPAAGERRRPREVPGRQRGHARHGPRRDRGAGAVAQGGGAGGARLPRHARGRGRGARAAAAPAGRDRGHGRAAGRRVPRPPGRRPPSRRCRAARPGCSSRPPGTPRPRRAPRPRGSSPTPAASTRWWSPAPRRGRCGASARTARAWAAAPPPARRPGPAGRTPRSRPSSSARTCGTSPR